MNDDLKVNFEDGNPNYEGRIVCAHCGNVDQMTLPESNWAIHSCGCPGHLDSLLQVDEGGNGLFSIPNLAERLEAFESALEAEPCTLKETILVDGEPKEISGCIIQSNSRRMCPSCRLRLYFYHTIYNWKAYNVS